MNIENIAKAKGTDKLTAEEINNAIRGAREDARRTVEQTLFTIVRRTRASSSQVMQLLFPFYAAYENTAKRWSGIIAENPQAVQTNVLQIVPVVLVTVPTPGTGLRRCVMSPAPPRARVVICAGGPYSPRTAR